MLILIHCHVWLANVLDAVRPLRTKTVIMAIAVDIWWCIELSDATAYMRFLEQHSLLVYMSTQCLDYTGSSLGGHAEQRHDQAGSIACWRAGESCTSHSPAVEVAERGLLASHYSMDVMCREFFPDDATADVAVVLGYALQRCNS